MWSAYNARVTQLRTAARASGFSLRQAQRFAERHACAPLSHSRARELLQCIGDPGGGDPFIIRALRLLQQLEPNEMPPLEHIRLLSLATSHGRCINGIIFISQRSDLYRAAEAGDLVPLALLIDHEHAHARDPEASEADVLQHSLRFAQRHGDEELITHVRRQLGNEA
jgi:hypothetical protein